MNINDTSCGIYEGKEGGGGLTEKNRRYQESKNIIFSFCLSFLVFLSVSFGYFCCTERSKSFFGNQCITIVDWLIFLMHINAKRRV